MQALKHHYEKIALAVLVAALLVVSLYLVAQVREAAGQEERLADITAVPERGRELTQLTDTDFHAAEMLREPDVDWRIGIGAHGSLAYPGPLMWCIDPDCSHWLPVTQEVCPNCETVQDVPEDPVIIGEQDTDGDGIPDEVEERYDFLDPHDPTDAHEDHDGDWFTNLEEYRYGTDMADPHDHPPLALKLFLLDVQRRRFDIIFSSLMASPQQPKDEWDIQLQVYEDGRWRTRFARLGQTVRGYTLEDINLKTEQVYSEALGAEISRDVSELVLRGPDDDRMILQRQRQQYSGVEVNFFLNTHHRDRRVGRVKTVREDEPLVLTSAVGNEERYTVSVRSPRLVVVRPDDEPEHPGFRIEPPRAAPPADDQRRAVRDGMPPPEFMPDGSRAPAPDWYRPMERR